MTLLKHITSLAAALFMFHAAASAQKIELGGSAGGGAFAVSSGGTAGSAQAGIEACMFCSGHLALFGEYNHWFAVEHGGYADRINNADLAGAGLRIQWRQLARMFFDVGFVGGRDRHFDGRGGSLGGIVIGAGVRVPMGKHWYIRPQFRVYGLSPHSLEGLDAHWAAGAGVGVGYIF